MTYPRRSLRKCATDDRSSDRSYAPHCANNPEPLASLPQGHHVSDQNFGESDKAATSNTLQGSANKKRSERVRRRSDDGTDKEEDKSHHNESSSTKDVRELGEAWLKDCGAEKERCASPESLDCSTIQVTCHDLNVQVSIDHHK